jgi:hypothetical protein
MYFDLAASVANAIELLIDAQQRGEDAYVEEAYIEREPYEDEYEDEDDE